MPQVGWLHPLSGERVPFGFFDTDRSAAGRSSYPPAMARAAERKILDPNNRHRGLDLTNTRMLTCARETILSVLFPYWVNPRKIGIRERGTLLHGAIARDWNEAMFYNEQGDGLLLTGELFADVEACGVGVGVSTVSDVLRFEQAGGGGEDAAAAAAAAAAPPRVVEIIDNKFRSDKKARWRDKPNQRNGWCGRAEFRDVLQLNVIRLLLAQTDWALAGGYRADDVLLTIYDYSCEGEHGPEPLQAPHMDASAIWAARPLVNQPGEKFYSKEEWDAAATVGEIVVAHLAAVRAYAEIPEGLRGERAVVEGVVQDIPLIGQRSGWKCKYCDVEPVCSELVRKYGGRTR